MTWSEYNWTGYFALGVEWNESDVNATTFTIAPTIWRWDYYWVDTGTTTFGESLTPDPNNGNGTGEWTGLRFVNGSGWRKIDTFAKRTYTKGHSTQTITLWLGTDPNVATIDNNGYRLVGNVAHPWYLTVPAKTSYKVTFNANGGSGAPGQQTKWYGESLTLSSTKPTRTGYKFVKWNTKSDGSGTSYNSGASYTANAAVTLYAIWTLTTYTVSYNGNASGATGVPSSQTKTHGKALTLTSSKPSLTGYTFSKWNTKSDGSGTSYSPGGSYTTDAAATLYARWTKITYSVTYNANGGSGAPGAQTKTYGTALTLSSTKPTRTGYTFSKWNTKSDGSGTSYNPGASYTANAALTLYAIWTANTWYVKYNANGGTGSMENSRHEYNTAKLLTNNGFSRSYMVTYYRVKNNAYSSSENSSSTATYTFKNWNTAANGSGTSYSNQASVKNLTSTAGGIVNLYAQWNSASVTLPTPTRTGYSFGGWYKESGCTNKVANGGASYTPTAAITLYPKWTINTYTVSYNANGGSGAPASQTKTYGTNLTLSSTKPTRTDCTFLGWATSNTATAATYQPGGSYTTDSGVTLYAVWASIPKITSLTAVRCDSNGTQNDEGTYAKITATWSVDKNVNSATSATATLYLDTTSIASSSMQSQSGTWSGNTGGTATAVVYKDNSPQVSIDNQYTFKFKVVNQGQEALRTVILTRAFFTMDFKSGGNGVGIFSAAPSNGLIVGKETTIQGTANVNGHVIAKSTNLDRDGSAPSSQTYGNATIRMHDVDGEVLSYIDVSRSTASSTITRIVNFNEYNGTGRYNYLSMAKPYSDEDKDGTMTWYGNSLVIRSNFIDRDGAVPSSDQYSPYLYFQDKDGETMGYIQTYRDTNGNSGMKLYGTNEVSGSGVSNGITMFVRSDGTRGIALTDTAAWRSALGLGTSGAFPITIGQGGTGATTAANARTNLSVPGLTTANYFSANQHISSSNINRDGSAPSSDAWGTHWTIMDKDNEAIAAFGSVQRTDRGIDAYMFAYNEKTDGTEVSNGIYARVAKDGTQSYYVSAPAAFRSAIGVGGLGSIATGATGDTAVSTAKETYVDLCNFTLAAGKWAVFATIEFATNTTGRRVACINTTAGGTGISLQWRTSGAPVTGGATRLKIAGVLQPSASTKYYLTSWQNSGGALNVYGTVQAIRII